MIAYALIALTWAAAVVVYKRGEARWRRFEQTVIPGAPSIRVADVMERKASIPPPPEEPIYLGRLAQTKAAQRAYERETSKVQVSY